MASTGFVEGTDLLVYWNGTAIAYSKNCTLNMELGNTPTTNKDDSGWEGILPTKRKWSVDGDGLYNYAGSVSDLFALYNNRSRVSIKFTNNTSGDKYYTGYAYITKLQLSAPDGETATYSFSFGGDGTLAEYAVT